MQAIKRRPLPDRTSYHGRSSQPLIDSQDTGVHHGEPRSYLAGHSTSEKLHISLTNSVSVNSRDEYVSIDSEAPPEKPRGKSTFDAEPTTPRQDNHEPELIHEHRSENHHVFRFWTWELLALFFAIALMIAKIVILAKFQDRELPKWPLSINLNTLIALLSILQRAALLLILAEILGQAKWLWFTDQANPLIHLHEFDEASRSVLGAIKLFFVGVVNSASISLKIMVLLAAWVTVVSFGIGPFSQQAISSKSCRQHLATAENASVRISHFSPGTGNFYRIGAGQFEVDSELKGTMVNGLTGFGSANTGITPHCPSGDCDFPDYGTGITYSSIGVCSRCFDTSSLVRLSPDFSNQTHYDYYNTLPDGTMVAYLPSNSPWITAQQSNLSYAEDLFPKDFAEMTANTFTNVSIMTFSMPPCRTQECRDHEEWLGNPSPFNNDTKVLAMSCTIYPCLKSYHGSVTGGILREKVVSTKPTNQNHNEHTLGNMDELLANFTAVQYPCVLDNGGSWYTAKNISKVPSAQGRSFVNISQDGTNVEVPEECVYKLGGVYRQGIRIFFRDLLNGNCTGDTKQGGNPWCHQKWWLSSLYERGRATPETISQHIEDLAVAMTNEFRRAGNIHNGGTNGHTLPATALGEQFETTVCTTFDWPWLLLPIVLIAATALLLLWILVQNKFQEKRQPVWKSSILPLLFYGLKGDGESLQSRTNGQDVRLATFSEIKDMSKRRIVQFSNGAGGLEPGFYGDEGGKDSGLS